jgi:hypothetical protein
MDRRRRDAECDGGALDGHDPPSAASAFDDTECSVRAQAADTVALQAKAARCLAALAIENAGNHRVGIVHGQPTDERDGVLLRAYRGLALARQGEVDIGQCTAFPAQDQMSRGLVALDLDDHLLDQRAEQLLAVARRGRGRPPDRCEVGPSVPIRLRSSLDSTRGRSVSRRASAAFAGSSAAMKARATASSICMPPMLRQQLPRPSTRCSPEQ